MVGQRAKESEKSPLKFGSDPASVVEQRSRRSSLSPRSPRTPKSPQVLHVSAPLPPPQQSSTSAFRRHISSKDFIPVIDHKSGEEYRSDSMDDGNRFSSNSRWTGSFNSQANSRSEGRTSTESSPIGTVVEDRSQRDIRESDSTSFVQMRMSQVSLKGTQEISLNSDSFEKSRSQTVPSNKDSSSSQSLTMHMNKFVQNNDASLNTLSARERSGDGQDALIVEHSGEAADRLVSERFSVGSLRENMLEFDSSKHGGVVEGVQTVTTSNVPESSSKIFPAAYSISTPPFSVSQESGNVEEKDFSSDPLSSSSRISSLPSSSWTPPVVLSSNSSTQSSHLQRVDDSPHQPLLSVAAVSSIGSSKAMSREPSPLRSLSSSVAAPETVDDEKSILQLADAHDKDEEVSFVEETSNTNDSLPRSTSSIEDSRHRVLSKDSDPRNSSIVDLNEPRPSSADSSHSDGIVSLESARRFSTEEDFHAPPSSRSETPPTSAVDSRSARERVRARLQERIRGRREEQDDSKVSDDSRLQKVVEESTPASRSVNQSNAHLVSVPLSSNDGPRTRRAAPSPPPEAMMEDPLISSTSSSTVSRGRGCLPLCLFLSCEWSSTLILSSLYTYVCP